MADVVADWRDFYSVLGEASATMIALLFVAASVGAGVFSGNRTAALRIFLSASVVHFSSILAVSLFVLSPLRSLVLLGGLVIGGGLFGLAYYVVTWRDMMRDGLINRIDLEDRTWYGYLPVATYVMETATGVMLALGLALGWPALALTMGTLMVISIHNAWDITVWSIGRRRE